MLTAHNYSFYHFWRNFSKPILIAFWCSGMMFGLCAAVSAGDVLSSLMRPVSSVRVSIVGLLLKTFFFFLLTVIVLFLSKPWLFMPAAFVRAFCLSYFLQALVLTGKQGAWLIMLVYSMHFLSASGLLWFWFRNVSGFSSNTARDVRICFLLHLIAMLTEYWIYCR